jgi:hypothetical protein
MPIEAEAAGVLVAGALLLLFVVTACRMHRSPRADPKFSFLMKWIEKAGGEPEPPARRGAAGARPRQES